MRVRINFEKTEAMRFTSHLDLHRSWERTIRRAKLPLTYSEGFNPRPRITLATALPLGFTSQGEIIEIRLDQELPLEDVLKPILKASPPGIVCREIYEVKQNSPKIPNLVESAEYLVTIPGDPTGLQQNIDELLAQDAVPRERRGKKYDLRPRIYDIKVQSTQEDETTLWMHLGASQACTGRPDEVLLQLGIDPNQCMMHRNTLILKDE